MFLKQKVLQPLFVELQEFSSATFAATAASYLLHCMHRAASLAVLQQHCWILNDQFPSCIASCAVLSLHLWDISGTVKNVTVVTVSLFFLLPSLVSRSPTVFWWGSSLWWMHQKQQVITMTHWAQISCCGAVVWWYHLPWRRNLWDSSVSVMLKWLFASYWCLHSCMHHKDELSWPSRAGKVQLK